MRGRAKEKPGSRRGTSGTGKSDLDLARNRSGPLPRTDTRHEPPGKGADRIPHKARAVIRTEKTRLSIRIA
ncbi:hypothetical protein GCM10010140_25730 [Streptosporangium pseudovulgare]|uniref:Uncharacterized protein n=1 Tax=Streptosporangium pseudovulgare TaxID=35765 RepID=A0ABQ2QVJ4_9ACTN|nr:hypothetical protein GCM10010140_25730 [Streptosporangium pseudovulgare]